MMPVQATCCHRRPRVYQVAHPPSSAEDAMTYAVNLPYSVTRRPNGPSMYYPCPNAIQPVQDQQGAGYFIDAAGVRVSTGSAPLDFIIKWGFWVGMAAILYKSYRVFRYDEPLFLGAPRTPAAWEVNPGKRVSKDTKKEILTVYVAGEPLEPIAKHFDVSVQWLKNFLLKSNVYLPEGPGVPYEAPMWEKKEAILSEYEPGMPLSPLASKHNVSWSYAKKWLEEAGVYKRIRGGGVRGRSGPKKRHRHRRSEGLSRRWVWLDENPARTEEQEELRGVLLEAYEPGVSINRLAASLGIPRATATKWLKEAGVYVPRGVPPELEEKRRLLISLYKPEMSLMKLAEDVGVNQITARKWLKEEGVYVPRKGRRTKRDLPEYSEYESLKEELFLRYTPGVSVRKLARELGIEPVTALRWLQKTEFYQPPDPSTRVLSEELQEKRRLLISRYEPKMSLRALAKDVGVNEATAKKWLVQEGIYVPRRGRRPKR